MHIDKGILCQELAGEDGAIRILSEAMTLSPGEADAYECRAESYMRIVKYAAALDDSNRALKIVAGSESHAKELARCYHWRGYVGLEMNKPRPVHEDLKRAASPGYGEAGSDSGE